MDPKKVRNVRRLINLMVYRDQNLYGELFTTAVAKALREYADGLDIDDPFDPNYLGDAVKEFTTSNGCIVRVIAGSYDLDRKD